VPAATDGKVADAGGREDAKRVDALRREVEAAVGRGGRDKVNFLLGEGREVGGREAVGEF